MATELQRAVARARQQLRGPAAEAAAAGTGTGTGTGRGAAVPPGADRGRASLLFSDPRAAARVDRATLLEDARAAAAQLEEETHCPLLRAGREALLDARSGVEDFYREKLLIAEGQALDEKLEAYLHALAPFLLTQQAQIVLEALIRVYVVHSYNERALLLAALPFHDTTTFVRLVRIMPLRDVALRFLGGVKTSDVVLPRSVLAAHCRRDPAFLASVCTLALRHAERFADKRTSDTTRAALQRVWSFYAATLVELFDGAGKVVPDRSMRALLRPLLSALAFRTCEPLQLAAYMVTARMVTRQRISTRLATLLARQLAENCCQVPDNEASTLRCLLCVLVYQDDSASTVYREAARVLREQPSTLSRLDDLLQRARERREQQQPKQQQAKPMQLEQQRRDHEEEEDDDDDGDSEDSNDSDDSADDGDSDSDDDSDHGNDSDTDNDSDARAGTVKQPAAAPPQEQQQQQEEEDQTLDSLCSELLREELSAEECEAVFSDVCANAPAGSLPLVLLSMIMNDESPSGGRVLTEAAQRLLLRQPFPEQVRVLTCALLAFRSAILRWSAQQEEDGHEEPAEDDAQQMQADTKELFVNGELDMSDLNGVLSLAFADRLLDFVQEHMNDVLFHDALVDWLQHNTQNSILRGFVQFSMQAIYATQLCTTAPNADVRNYADALVSLLGNVQHVLDLPSSLALSQELLRHENVFLRRKALTMLTDKIQTLKRQGKLGRPAQALLLDLLPELRRTISGFAERVLRERANQQEQQQQQQQQEQDEAEKEGDDDDDNDDDDEDESDPIVMQSALLMIHVLIQHAGLRPEKHHRLLERVLRDVVVTMEAFGHGENVQVYCTACMVASPLIRLLRELSVQSCPALLASLLSEYEWVLEQCVGNSSTPTTSRRDMAMVLNAVLSSLAMTLGIVSQFMSSNLTPRALEILMRSPPRVLRKIIVHRSDLRKAIENRTAVIIALQGLVPMRIIFPALQSVFADADPGLFGELVDFSNGLLKQVQRTEFMPFASDFFDLILHSMLEPALDFDNVPRLFIEFAIKLNERELRGFFARLSDWQRGANAPLHRRNMFYALTIQLAKRLRGISQPLLDAIMDDCRRELLRFTKFAAAKRAAQGEQSRSKRKRRARDDDNNAENENSDDAADEDESVREETRLVERCVAVLSIAFGMDDKHAHAENNRFSRLMPAITDLLAGAYMGEKHTGWYARFVKKYLAPCLSTYAEALGEDARWKPLNHRVLLQMRNDVEAVRIGALRTFKQLYERVGEDYLLLVGESLPYLAELLEDGAPEVEELARDVMRGLEELSGEDFDQYLH